MAAVVKVKKKKNVKDAKDIAHTSAIEEFLSLSQYIHFLKRDYENSRKNFIVRKFHCFPKFKQEHIRHRSHPTRALFSVRANTYLLIPHSYYRFITNVFSCSMLLSMPSDTGYATSTVPVTLVTRKNGKGGSRRVATTYCSPMEGCKTCITSPIHPVITPKWPIRMSLIISS